MTQAIVWRQRIATRRGCTGFALPALLVATMASCMTSRFCHAETSSDSQSHQRPNIVLIMADDMGFECIGANGSLDYQTPNIDRIASEGLRFEHCYSQPICTPSRVKLMTGQSNKRNYVKFGMLDREQTTFAHLLKEAGYRTCIAGKWQLGSELDSPQHFGFEQSLLWQHTRGRMDAKKHDTRYPNPRLERNGVEENHTGGAFSSDLFADFLCEFMEENRDQPFLAYYPMALVHCPFCPTPDSKSWDPESLGSKTYKGQPEHFGDMVAYVDKIVGRIDQHLRDLGIRENTLLLFTGDNGTDTPIVTQTRFGEVVGAKGEMVDAGNHVTCIARWPDQIDAGRVTSQIVDFSDFLPTMCEVAGARVPEELPIDGISFLPVLRGEEGKGREAMFMWYERNGRPKKAREFARNQRYKLYGDGEFFDVQEDRNEKSPLTSLILEQEQIREILQAKIDSFADVVPPQAR
ncbi:sulfatase-like hydrolase/transferase [Rhodopirellula halodulae]|uniref:sulfatase-like hydrolase/transferase n=1 Tax=Rhodopirellula halodulae TaxID=2894198 RepID=UPI001E2FD72E|nr:sulfatase-like hydrolase/transferase [Rhodopirellula sp. JC737]